MKRYDTLIIYVNDVAYESLFVEMCSCSHEYINSMLSLRHLSMDGWEPVSFYNDKIIFKREK
jgi:hypothetical protein